MLQAENERERDEVYFCVILLKQRRETLYFILGPLVFFFQAFLNVLDIMR